MIDFSPILDRLDHLENLLIQAQGKPTGWLDMKAAAKYADLSVSTIKRAVESGGLKAAKGTGKCLFRPEWIDRFVLLGHCRKLTPFEKDNIGL